MDPDATAFLMPEYDYVRTNSELDTAEGVNIGYAMQWAAHEEWTTTELLQQSTLREIHRQMLGQVWQWAGSYRSREVNIGNCSPEDISTRLEQVLGNLAYQAETGREAREVATEYHHSIGQIHPFVNGNGRHARLTTAKLSESMGLPVGAVVWRINETDPSEVRRITYLAALGKADRGDFKPLQEFLFGAESKP